MTSFDATIVGAGVFGVTAAIELQQRGFKTCLVDPGPIPHPLAASTDISKAVRMEYGADEQYTDMVEACLPKWRDWNAEFAEYGDSSGPLFHETGITMFTRVEMRPGEFEYESYQMLKRRGYAPSRLGAAEISDRFPGWKPGAYVDGFYNAVGGFAESGRVVSALVEKAARLGVVTRESFAVAAIDYDPASVKGVRSSTGEIIESAQVVVAAGAWTRFLVPDLASAMLVTGHPVFHLRSQNDRNFKMGAFATFMADISRTGWYGFPVHPREGVFKVANHGIGTSLHPDDERVVTPGDEASLREFLWESFPEVADSEIVYTRRCLYCDTLDGHFWISAHPEIAGLTVATGGSGHGFKFAPILGELIADAVEGIPNKSLPRFSWRSLEGDAFSSDAARYAG